MIADPQEWRHTASIGLWGTCTVEVDLDSVEVDLDSRWPKARYLGHSV